MDKQKVRLGGLITLASIIFIALLTFLIVKIPILQELIFTILGPLSIMTLFVGLFMLLAGLMHKEEVKNKSSK